MVEAEFLGVDSASADAAQKDGSPAQKRLLGSEGDAGDKLGLDANWGYNIVKQVGNYGESFERNVGSGSPLQISRGINAQWNKGGLMYSSPIR